MHRFIVYSIRFQLRLTWNPPYLSSGPTYNMTLYYCSDEQFNYILKRRPLLKRARSFTIHINEDEFRRSSYLREHKDRNKTNYYPFEQYHRVKKTWLSSLLCDSTKWTHGRYIILSRAVISAFLLTFNALSCTQKFYS